MPPFEEYYLSYADRTVPCAPEFLAHVGPSLNGIVRPILVARGEVVGVWTHSVAVGRHADAPVPELFAPGAATDAEIGAALDRYRAFITDPAPTWGPTQHTTVNVSGSKTLTCTAGQREPGTALSYAWKRSSGHAKLVAVGTGRRYKPGKSDAGRRVACVERRPVELVAGDAGQPGDDVDRTAAGRAGRDQLSHGGDPGPERRGACSGRRDHDRDLSARRCGEARRQLCRRSAHDLFVHLCQLPAHCRRPLRIGSREPGERARQSAR